MIVFPSFGILGWPEIMAIMVIVLVLFFARHVPEFMRGRSELSPQDKRTLLFVGIGFVLMLVLVVVIQESFR